MKILSNVFRDSYFILYFLNFIFTFLSYYFFNYFLFFKTVLLSRFLKGSQQESIYFFKNLNTSSRQVVLATSSGLIKKRKLPPTPVTQRASPPFSVSGAVLTTTDHFSKLKKMPYSSYSWGKPHFRSFGQIICHHKKPDWVCRCCLVAHREKIIISLERWVFSECNVPKKVNF